MPTTKEDAFLAGYRQASVEPNVKLDVHVILVSEDRWMSPAEVAEKAPEIVGRELNPRTVTTYLWRQHRKRSVRRRKVGGRVQYHAK